MDHDASVRRADSEIRLAARALRECWPVPADRREGLVKVLLDVAEDPRAKGRDRAIAIKSLLSAGRLNLEAVKVAQACEYGDVLGELRALREELGCGQLGEGPSGIGPAP